MAAATCSPTSGTTGACRARWTQPLPRRRERRRDTGPGRVPQRGPGDHPVLAHHPDGARVPLLIVWSVINRYYILDLAKDRSFIEYALSQGLQVFVTSWRNPGPEHGDWDLDTYAQALLDATDAIREITGSEQVGTVGLCAGGQLLAAVDGAPHRDRRRPDRLRGLRRQPARHVGAQRRGTRTAPRAAHRRARGAPKPPVSSTAGPSPRSSPGCGPTSSSGTSG